MKTYWTGRVEEKLQRLFLQVVCIPKGTLTLILRCPQALRVQVEKIKEAMLR